MSMTREEASVLLKIMFAFWANTHERTNVEMEMALNLALSALRPVGREQVEKLWRGCEQCQPSCGTCEHMYEWDKYGKPQECTSCKENGYVNYISDSKFCEYCGRPLTNEAVQIVMERMEALKDA